MDTKWGSIHPVSIRWDLFLTLIVIWVTCCSALEKCPYRSCRACDIEYLTCQVKCCQMSIYIYCCGDNQNGKDNTQDERPSSFPVSIVLGMGAAIILIILLTCILCVLHTNKTKARRINTRRGALNREIRRMNRNGQEPMALQNSLEMSVIRKPPPYVENPPLYCQIESNINIYGDTFEDVQLPGTVEEINRCHSTLPPPYSEIAGTLSAPADTTLQRY